MQCDYFDAGRCRSCALMGVPYAVQLADRDAHCRRVLADVAPDVAWLDPAPSAESAFRNKAKLVVGGSPGAVTVGILDRDGFGTDLRHCGLYEPGLAELVPRVADLLDDLGLEPYEVPSRRGEVKHVLLTHSPGGETMLRFVLRSQKHLALLRSRLAALQSALPGVRVVSVNLQPEHKAVTEGEVELVLTEADVLTMPLADVELFLRPNSFFQTNTGVATALYRQARDWVALIDPSVVLDLYCGVGGFALQAAIASGRTDRVVRGLEIAPEAVASARRSAAALSAAGLTRADLEFTVGDATDVALLPGVGGHGTGRPRSSLVVVNPPRRGIGPRLAAWLETSSAEHVVYSSCNVDSLARDLAAMPSLRAVEARLFDMFPQTSHHEVAVLLERIPLGSRRTAGLS
ncbi:23S rRNA (uracil(747)-C(5))-methyltransferase RlmC [Terrabacter aerolatus]|uniref:23S rRNA (Uracil(747)-C(5))-methyltransferase RlmC n=1 Tax=Terrabacter aerolatus TaxID=422442 RepID=A0A512D256_9MICO|nr:methyltransferase domain-containing protein [Terrabacter aerolatus]GEO30544.1 23S rRNA (uracil(747)-C(5))-methyltransferase RlmC [Terrabacter aerolatus]